MERDREGDRQREREGGREREHNLLVNVFSPINLRCYVLLVCK